jgi:hypothetical protein
MQLKKYLHFKGFDPSSHMIDSKIRWIYIDVIFKAVPVKHLFEWK